MESRIGNRESAKGRVVSLPPLRQYVSRAQDLEVYMLAYKLSLEIHKVTLEMPKIEQYALADQLRRSSKSICANLAEGYARQRQSALEFKRFIAIAIGSCSESMVWLDYARDLGYIRSEQNAQWSEQYAIIERMLAKLRNTVKQHGGGKS